jgi:hypothetical protein
MPAFLVVLSVPASIAFMSILFVITLGVTARPALVQAPESDPARHTAVDQVGGTGGA